MREREGADWGVWEFNWVASLFYASRTASLSVRVFVSAKEYIEFGAQKNI